MIKRKFIRVVLFSFLCFSATAQKKSIVTPALPYKSAVWVADNGDGTYKNPILFADYSDPDVIRVGDDYYLTASSFNCMPGLPILHSKDLVNWRIINHALKQQIPADIFDVPQHGKGVWAPSFQYHNKTFYIYYPDPDYGIYMIRTSNPASDWEKPVLVLPGKGIIDPSCFWDEDGKAYLVVGWAASRAGVNSLLTVFKLNNMGSAVTDEGKHVYDGHKIDPTVEGPKFFKRNGYYYLLPPAGGVGTGWQLALRSKNIYGPYERKVVMDQGSTNINGPHQGALVQTQTGEYWFLHFQDKGAYGRILHLQPVSWNNDWPVMGNDKDGDGKGEPVLHFKKPSVGKIYPVETPAENDEFNTGTLGLQWQWHANPKIQWSSLLPAQGFLRLFAFPSEKNVENLWPVPNLLLQKFPAPDFTVTTRLEYTVEREVWQGKKAGLLIMGNDYSYLSIAKNEKGFYLGETVCKDALNEGAEKVMDEIQLTGSTVFLRVTVSSPGASCIFSYSEDGVHFTNVGKPFTAKPDKWIGAKVGLFCTGKPGVANGGYVDVDWFRITRNE
ncbi:MAG: glycoside hydrolase 43 family protein [Ferruginibacter sp.]